MLVAGAEWIEKKKLIHFQLVGSGATVDKETSQVHRVETGRGS